MDMDQVLDMDLSRNRPCRAICSRHPRVEGESCHALISGNIAGMASPPAMTKWASFDNMSPPSTSSWDTPPSGAKTPTKTRGGVRGMSRWSPDKTKQVYRGTGTTRILAQAHLQATRGLSQVGQPPPQESPVRRSALKPALAPTPAPAVAYDAVVLL